MALETFRVGVFQVCRTQLDSIAMERNIAPRHVQYVFKCNCHATSAVARPRLCVEGCFVYDKEMSWELTSIVRGPLRPLSWWHLQTAL